jgi:hypothetical protein
MSAVDCLRRVLRRGDDGACSCEMKDEAPMLLRRCCCHQPPRLQTLCEHREALHEQSSSPAGECGQLPWPNSLCAFASRE